VTTYHWLIGSRPNISGKPLIAFEKPQTTRQRRGVTSRKNGVDNQTAV